MRATGSCCTFTPRTTRTAAPLKRAVSRDEREIIAELGNARVVGVSKDTVVSHKKFADKYALNFTLLSDPDHQTIEAYDSWKPKKFMGREFMGTHRNTFIITPDGKIAKKYEGVDPKTHVAHIIADLRALQTAQQAA